MGGHETRIVEFGAKTTFRRASVNSKAVAHDDFLVFLRATRVASLVHPHLAVKQVCQPGQACML